MPGASREEQKKAAAESAVQHVQDGMRLGLGTGSTVSYALDALGRLVAGGMQLKGVPTSIATAERATELGIPLIKDESSALELDLGIDGADEADGACRLIKGGGGALTREKIVAARCRQMLIIVDEAKAVESLGAFPLPVEVVPMAWQSATREIERLGARASALRGGTDSPVVTDNGNYVLDCEFERIDDPDSLEIALNQIPGVLENGLFIGLCSTLIIGLKTGGTRSVDCSQA